MPVLGQPCCELVTTGGEWLAAQCRGCTFVAGHQPTHTHFTLASHSLALSKLPVQCWECVEALRCGGTAQGLKFNTKLTLKT